MTLSSIDAARRVFDRYAALEPRLAPLWQLCRSASAPVNENADLDDDTTDDGWCVEMFFFEHVKSELVQLVGWYRVEDPPELRRSSAYDEVYAALQVALNRTCSCCRD
jgi:hypothetical protein